MKQEQFDKLQLRAEQLTDVFLGESDPQTWCGVGIEPKNMDRATRGDRYWCKRNAAATLSVVQRIVSIIDRIREKTAAGEVSADAVTDDEKELDAEVAAAEREAEALMNRALRRARKPDGKP